MACHLPMAETILVTGANQGLGYETCRQLAVGGLAKRIVMACRNATRAAAAAKALRELPGVTARIEVLICDVSSLDSVAAAVTALQGSLDGLLANAGGMGDEPGAMTPYGTSTLFADNVLGHAALIEGLIAAGKLAPGCKVVFSGSEMSRGVNKMVMPFGRKFEFAEPTEACIDTFITGAAYPGGMNGIIILTCYGDAKGIGTAYTSALAKKYSDYGFYTISPGACPGTEVSNHKAVPGFLRHMLGVMGPMLKCMGLGHPIKVGAGRYVEGLLGEGPLGAADASGKFFASNPASIKLSGPNFDQYAAYPILADPKLHDACYKAIHRHLPK